MPALRALGDRSRSARSISEASTAAGRLGSKDVESCAVETPAYLLWKSAALAPAVPAMSLSRRIHGRTLPELAASGHVMTGLELLRRQAGAVITAGNLRTREPLEGLAS